MIFENNFALPAIEKFINYIKRDQHCKTNKSANEKLHLSNIGLPNTDFFTETRWVVLTYTINNDQMN